MFDCFPIRLLYFHFVGAGIFVVVFVFYIPYPREGHWEVWAVRFPYVLFLCFRNVPKYRFFIRRVRFPLCFESAIVGIADPNVVPITCYFLCNSHTRSFQNVALGR